MDLWKFFIFCAFLVSISDGLSFLGKQHMHAFQVNAVANGKKYTGKELTGSACADILNREKCNSFQPYCGTNEYIKDNCRKTCGICQSYQPSCKNTALGCCWDNVTAIENGKKCPACEDINADCKIMKVNCMDDLTRRLCPVTCGVECEMCIDDPNQAEHCAGFKKFGICASDPDLMKEYCKKSCGFC